MFGLRKMSTLPTPQDALPGRETPMPLPHPHVVFGRPLDAPVPEGLAQATFGMGCFWGVERLFWTQPGVWLTAAGYAGGATPNPTYREVCSGRTGHAEVVRLVHDPAVIGYDRLLRLFWEGHDPTQGMRQGNDTGTQYRSVIHTHDAAQAEAAAASAAAYGARLAAAGLGPVTTEIRPAPPFYFAEDEHQQYLAKHPGGYCGLRGTGVACAS
ncbi:peptide-methionine (S)-S-oxide reductase MsrA [Phaeovulum vinaykumarii]|uniref:Peptide methionine sulfoxide reductase MsrA n=1 Tax=Phaeovulum vinaykumarii TaxID=407234 RepID=A0A1N7KXZ2_9RHOB|nr:peptide-methionine (S)-S-oxide reductase MsrA [Phaeovulum vinaykumarii]SIS66448.1 peptide-methionine (S)-S-oxide reductase [Phaeovulum vinaykumarii]SOC01083.1 peptide-methionine (S)-S-oxide reductase [Phaeovulum vinaykumarii]